MATVNLEQFREAVEFRRDHWLVSEIKATRDGAAYAAKAYAEGAAECDRLLSIIDSAGKVELVADETGPYPFGAGIEPNPKARYWQQRADFWMGHALRLGYTPPDDAAQQPAACDTCDGRGWIDDVHEQDDGRIVAAPEYCPRCKGSGHKAAQQPAAVVDEAMVDRYLAAQAKAVQEIDNKWGNGGKAPSYIHPVREACRAALTAALSGVGQMNIAELRAIAREMRERKVNHNGSTSPTLCAWADRIDAAVTDTAVVDEAAH